MKGPLPRFTLDLGRCVGCGACVLACRIENGLSLGVSWRRVLQVNQARIGAGPTYHLSVACHHCEAPPCATACPTRALEKGKDGPVLLEAERCIGCRYCEMACPFGAPSFDAEAGVMTKCHLCHHRLEQNLSPACVSACPTGALGLVLSAAEVTDEEVQTEAKRPSVPGASIPGFGDPANARPGFWVAEPTGAIRSAWFAELVELLGKEAEDPHDPA